MVYCGVLDSAAETGDLDEHVAVDVSETGALDEEFAVGVAEAYELHEELAGDGTDGRSGRGRLRTGNRWRRRRRWRRRDWPSQQRY